jgi:riboflavin kinase/FMN adenylyltransferase
VPQNGVYVVQAEIDGKTIYGMMNIGFNPTVQGKQKTIEAHFFDFETDIYNRKIQVAILQRIRSEKKFESIELLTKQLDEDRSFSRNYLQNLENK